MIQKLLFSFLAALVAAFSLGQAKPENFTSGSGAVFGTNWDYTALKADSRTCVRFVVRAKADYPGGGLPPKIYIDTAAVTPRIVEALQSGVSVVLGVETTRQENAALWKAAYERGDYSRYDELYRQVANFVRVFDDQRLMVEFFSGEPGWYLTDTQGIGGNDVQLRESSRILQNWNARTVPMFRLLSPRTTLLLAFPGRGHFTGSPGSSGEYKYVTQVFPNSFWSFHGYTPFEVCHDGDAGRPLRVFSWPQPDWRLKFPDFTTTQLNNVAYTANYIDWSDAGLSGEFDKVQAWANRIAAKVYFGEFGCTASNRSLPGSRAFIAAFRRMVQARGWGCCEWLG